MARRIRLFLSTKHIQVLHQVTERTARTTIKKIKTVFEKAPHQPITVTEYAIYMNVSPDDVHRALDEWGG